MAQHLIDVVAETRAAVTMELYLKIDAILQHPKCVEAFHRLQALKRIPAEVDVAEWQRNLLDKFRERASLPADEQPWAHAVFEIRGSQRWVNGMYQPSPVILYEILIPEDALKSHASALDGDGAYHGLTIRTFVLNGVLKVQVGQWGDEEEGSREPGQIVPWMAWDTITTFPLLLNPADHYLPTRFLLLDYFIQPMHRPEWSRAKRRFQRDVEYRRAEHVRRIRRLVSGTARQTIQRVAATGGLREVVHSRRTTGGPINSSP
jgi:hypothetical protein